MNRGERRRIGPTEDQYKRAHPEVNWDTHEVLYTIRNAGSLTRDGFMVTEIQGHHRKPDHRELWRMLDDSDGLERGTHARWAWERERAKGSRHDLDD